MATMIVITTVVVVLALTGFLGGFISTILGVTWGIGHATIKSARNPSTGYKQVKADAKNVHDKIVTDGVGKGVWGVGKDLANSGTERAKGLLGKIDAWLESSDASNREDEEPVAVKTTDKKTSKV